jgi:hypothetical protein
VSPPRGVLGSGTWGMFFHRFDHFGDQGVGSVTYRRPLSPKAQNLWKNHPPSPKLNPSDAPASSRAGLPTYSAAGEIFELCVRQVSAAYGNRCLARARQDTSGSAKIVVAF